MASGVTNGSRVIISDVWNDRGRMMRIGVAPVIVGIWPDPADNEANTRWVRNYYAAIHPHSGSDGGYVNFMSGDDGHRTAANYGANYERLSAVKAVYVPDNLFHVNQNIAPANGR